MKSRLRDLRAARASVSSSFLAARMRIPAELNMYLKRTAADHEGPQAELESLRYSIAEEARH